MSVATIPVRVVGAVCVVGALVAWAWTLTELTPHMPRMHEIAPTPGVDGELFLRVAELRWGAILLAAPGLMAVAMKPATGVALAAALVVADGFVERSGPAGKLVPVLLLGVAAVGGAWVAARTVPATDPAGEAVRWRLTAIGVTGVAGGPVLLAQGTPAVNHPFLPAPTGTTVSCPAGGRWRPSRPRSSVRRCCSTRPRCSRYSPRSSCSASRGPASRPTGCPYRPAPWPRRCSD